MTKTDIIKFLHKYAMMDYIKSLHKNHLLDDFVIRDLTQSEKMA